MRPDHRLREGEAEGALEQALRSYMQSYEARDVLLYVAHRESPLSWNELQAKASLSPPELSRRIDRVDRHLRACMDQHLEA